MYMKKIGIITAMEEEFQEVEKLMTEKEVKRMHNIEFYEGKIKDKKCVLAKCGVGKVHAARLTQSMIDNFKLDFIINVGTAGAINPKLKIGDLVVGRTVVQHDFDITAFGHSKGYITGIGNYVKCDDNLLEKLKETINKMPETNYEIKLGIVATGDIFCTEKYMKEKIRTKFDADIVDMECGAIAQVCYLEEMPFLVIRTVSDVPNGENARTFDENLRLASRRSANVLKEFLMSN